MAGALANEVRLAASVGVSLAIHLLLMTAVPSLRPAAGQADGAQSRLFVVSLPGAAPAPLQVQGEAAPSAAPTADIAPRESDPRIDSQPASALAIPIPLVAPEPPFFTLAELDTPPAAMQDIEADPPELRQYSEGGKLVVRLWIDETGKVVRAEVVNSELPEAFAESARERFMRAAFHPAKKNGVAVRARVNAMIVYRPRS